MAQQSAQKKKKTKKRQISPLLLALRVVAVLLVVLMLFFFGARMLGNVTITNLMDSAKSWMTGLTAGNQFPYAVDAANVTDLKSVGSDLALLADRSAVVLNSNARKQSEQQTTYSDPGMAVCNGRIVVYDRSSGKLRLQSRTEILQEKDIKQEILTCAVGKQGNVAVAARSADATSELTVFDKELNQILFQWRSSSAHIIAVALSPDGKYAAAAAVGADTGELFSDVFVFQMSKAEPVATLRYPGTTVVNLQFGARGKILVTGDNLHSVITDYSQRGADEPFTASTLTRASFAENGAGAVLLSKYGSTQINELIMYDKHGKASFTKKFGEAVRWISCDGTYVAVLFDDRVETYRMDGRAVGTITSSSDTLRVLVRGSKTYVLAVSELRRYATAEKPAAG